MKALRSAMLALAIVTVGLGSIYLFCLLFEIPLRPPVVDCRVTTPHGVYYGKNPHPCSGSLYMDGARGRIYFYGNFTVEYNPVVNVVEP